jgi:hypothetical protein
MDTLKFFFKLWSYFIGFAIGLALVIWTTVTVGNYSIILGIFVFFVGVGGLASAVLALGLR